MHSARKGRRPSERRAIIGGIGFNYIRIAVFLVLSLIYPPYLLAHVGKVDNGLLSFAVSLLQAFTLVSVGIENSYIHFATNREKQRGSDGLRLLNGSYLILFSLVSLVILALGIGTAFIYRSGTLSVAGSGADKAELVFWLIIIITVMTAVEFFGSFFAFFALFRRNFIHHQVILIIMRILTVSFAMLSLHLGQGVLVVALVMLGVQLLDMLVNIIHAMGELKMRFSFDGREFIKADLKEIFRFSIFIFLTMVVTQIQNNAGKLILSYRLGGSAVTVFGYGLEFYTYAALLSKGVSDTVGPKIHTLIAEKNEKEAGEVFLRSAFIIMSVLFFIFGGYALVGRDFIAFWLRNGDLSDTEIQEVFIIGLCSLAVWILPLSQGAAVEIRRAEHKHHFFPLANILLSVIGVVISIILTWLLPDQYIVYGPLIGSSVFAFFGPFLAAQLYYGKSMSIPLGRFYRDFLIFAIINGMSFALPFCLDYFFFDSLSGWLSFVLRIVLFVLLFLLLYLLIFRKRIEKMRQEPEASSPLI